MTRYYNKEFKEQAVELLINSGKSIKQIARELGCSSNSLGAWKRDYEEKHSVVDKSMVGMNIQELWEHNKKLEKELKIVKEEREILKKAAAILGR